MTFDAPRSRAPRRLPVYLALPIYVALAISLAPLGASAQDDATAEAAPADPESAVIEAIDAVDAETLEELGDQDAELTARLSSILGAVEEFSDVRVEFNHGVARLMGEVPSSETHEQVVALAGSLDGVVYVDDELSEPVAVRDRIAPVKERLEGWAASAIDNAPLWALALLVVVFFHWIGVLLSRRDALYKTVVKRAMFRDLARRLTVLAFTAVGVLIALEIVDATALVGTILGAAGVLGLALGFAFRDIVENYLASLLLAARRPFALGDAVKIGEEEGKVVKLTMRETLLMTFDGNHLSLPNASVFKANVLNYSRNPNRRFDFVVGAGVDTDLVTARRLGETTLRETKGTLDEPAPYSIIEQLGDSNVALRFYGWVDQRHADFQKVRSEAIRRVKTALEDAGIDMPEPIYRVHMTQDGEPVAKRQAERPTRRDVEDHEVDVSVDDTIDRQIAEEHAADDENLLKGAA